MSAGQRSDPSEQGVHPSIGWLMFVEFGWIAQHLMKFQLQVVEVALPCVGVRDGSARGMLELRRQWMGFH